MSKIRSIMVASCSLGLAAGIAAAAPVAAQQPAQGNSDGHSSHTPPERQTVPEGDGFASAGSGTTGGSQADEDRVYDVSTRAEMNAAFEEAGEDPKIIRVRGEVLGNADRSGSPLTCEDYAEGTGYSLDAYLAAYDPAIWGWEREPEGELENARQAAAEIQKDTMLLDVPSNTTIIGATPDATLNGLSLRVDGSENVIIRNLTHRAVSDCFPQWDPTDGDLGNWNSEYDMVQIINGATNIWIDHNYYTDDPDFDDEAPVYFERPFQQHDGAVDITNGSDLVNVTYNRFADRDKLMLIGSTDSDNRGDPGKLNVTVHHNEFLNIGQRGPRLRWGHADVYNNHYIVNGDARVDYVYSLGVGYESHIWAENNAFTISSEVDSSQILRSYRGTAVATKGNVVNRKHVDLLDAYNSAAPADEQLVADRSWKPTLRNKVHPAQAVPGILKNTVGPFGQS